MEWLISHPEEAPMEPAPAPAPPQNDQVPAVAKEMNLVPAQVLLPRHDCLRTWCGWHMPPLAIEHDLHSANVMASVCLI